MTYIIILTKNSTLVKDLFCIPTKKWVSGLAFGTLFSFEARKYMEIRITRQKSQSVMVAQCGR